MSDGPRVLVTGAGGLVGRHVVAALAGAITGARVVPVARRDAGRYGDGLAADLTDAAAVRALARCEPQVIVHAAATLPSTLDDEVAASANQVIDRNVFELAATLGARVLFVSSAAVYAASARPWSEASVSGPLPAYAAAKLASEKRLRQAGLDAVVMRISSPYSAANCDRQGILFHFVRQAVAGKDLVVSGLGTRAQDFIHAVDIARAVVRVVGRWAGAQPGQPAFRVFNIASGAPVEMGELADVVIGACGSGKKVVQGIREEADSYRAEISVAKARAELDWATRITLAAGVGQMVRRLRGGGNEDWLSL